MNKKEKGSVLILAVLILGVLLFVGSYLLSFAFTGSKMADSQAVATQTYYLAEAGIKEAVFKLKNDSVWKSAFETLPTVEDPDCSSWSIVPYTRDADLFENGGYSITVNNLGCAKAEIISQARIQTSGDKMAQRIVRVKVFKAIGSPVSDFAIFTGGASENLYIKFTDPLNIHNGNLFSNKSINIKYYSEVNVDKKALSNGNILVSLNSQLNATSCSDNMCDLGCEASADCPPEKISMPSLDFDSESGDSYLSSAQNDICSSVRIDGKTNCLFSSEEFELLMWQNYPQLSLPENVVVYVTGDINIRAGEELTVNGVLAGDRDINIGEDYCWGRSEYPYFRCGNAQLKVNRPGLPEDNFPSGILAKRKISGGGFLGLGVGSLNINGLVYAGDEIRISSAGSPIEIHGGIAARKFTLSSLWQGVDIYLDSDVIIDTFKNPSYSPIITIDHWEEEY